MTTLVDLLERSAAEHRERTALTIRSGLREDVWSYRRLGAAADALAAHLAEDAGLESGARVVVWGPSCPQLAATLFGVLRARLVVVPLDPYATPELLERVLERTGAALLISGFGTPGGVATLDLAALPLDVERPCSCARPGPADVAEIVFTSGTTGRPKGVVLTHANVVANVRSARAALQPTRDFRLLSVLPLSHMFEQTAGLFLPLSVGASVHYATSRQSPVILRTMRRHRVTAMAVVPQVLELLLAGIEREVERRGSLDRWRAAHRLAPHLPITARRALFRSVHRELGGRLELVVSGGAALDPEVAASWERLGVTVLEGYGATECAPSIASNTRAARRAGSVGRPVPGVAVRLDEQGEILVRGANVSPGYWRDEEATGAALTDDGWYRTGDLGALDRDGFLHLHGRLKDLIVLPSGLNVFPEDVEPELLREDAVADCAVVGAPDEEGRPRVHAVVVPARPGAEAHGRVADAVRAANARLAPHQRISSFTLWEHGDLPRTSLLKVKRHAVAAALAGSKPTEPTAPRPTAAVDRHERLLRLLGGLAPPGTAIRPASDLTLDLGLDSLARVELAVRLETELGLAVEDGDLASASTVADLAQLVDTGEVVSAPVAFPGWALRAPARVARASIQALLLFPAHALTCSPFTVRGRDHLDGLESPVLLVANHTSHLDTPSILRALPRRLRSRVAVAAAADYLLPHATARAGDAPPPERVPLLARGGGALEPGALRRARRPGVVGARVPGGNALDHRTPAVVPSRHGSARHRARGPRCADRGRGLPRPAAEGRGPSASRARHRLLRSRGPTRARPDTCRRSGRARRRGRTASDSYDDGRPQRPGRGLPRSRSTRTASSGDRMISRVPGAGRRRRPHAYVTNAGRWCILQEKGVGR